MPESGFLEWVRFIRTEAESWGIPISARKARALVPAVITAFEQLGLPPHPDPTGEAAVRRVLAAA